MTKTYSTIFAAILSISSFSTLGESTMPKGWLQAGSNTIDFEMGMDDTVSFDGSRSAYIKSLKPEVEGFATMMQTASVDDYLGKRVQLSISIKTESISGWAGAWLRIDGKDSKAPLAFDNMQNRAIKGSTDWKKYSIILDVPEQASQMAYGVLTMGDGNIWFDNLSFTVVDKSVPVTSEQKKKKPSNLSFEQE